MRIEKRLLCTCESNHFLEFKLSIVTFQLHTLCQGKFILVDRFDVIERNDLRRRYKGKVFLFERCVIYTQIEGKNKLLYRGHFRYSTLGFTFEDQRNYFKLYNERRGNQEIEFHSDPQTLHSWIQTLNRVMEKVVLRGLFQISSDNLFFS